MIAIAVDDESWALEDLVNRLNGEEDITEIHSFSKGTDAFEWAQENKFDIAFLDINMRGMDGLELGKKLREINSRAYIVFCTAYADYALDACRMHALGYLLKPIEQAELHEELEYITNWTRKGSLISVRCYGGFEVYDSNGNMISFKRKRAKEVLALPVDKNGLSLSSRVMCALMFADDGGINQKNLNHVYKLLQELFRSLEEIGAGAIVKKNSGDYYLDMSMIKIAIYQAKVSYIWTATLGQRNKIVVPHFAICGIFYISRRHAICCLAICGTILYFQTPRNLRFRQ